MYRQSTIFYYNMRLAHTFFNMKTLYYFYKLLSNNKLLYNPQASVIRTESLVSYQRLNPRTLGSLFYKYLIMIPQGSDDPRGINTISLFCARYLFTDRYGLYFSYDVKSLLHIFTNFYNIFFYSGMHGAKVTIYTTTKFKNL